MIYLYNSTKYFSDDAIISDNESFFNNNISPTQLDKQCEMIMKNIDNAIILDKNIGTIQTPFGITGIQSLSLGCKTVLNYVLMSKERMYDNIKAIDATECGWNALEELFKVADSLKSDIAIILEHENNTFKCSDRDIMLNGNKLIHSMFEFSL